MKATRRLLFVLLGMPLAVAAQDLDARHILVDAEATVSAPYIYNTFQEAAASFTDSMTVYIKPGVYWIDDPDDLTVKTGKDGREPFGMVVRCPHLRLVGLGETPQDVVLASQRGQTQGAIGNFTMFDFWVKTLKVENLTMGNYCNVDLIYPKNPQLNRPKRSDAITQAHVGYVHGDTLIAQKVRFVSRLNLNPLNGAAYSYYEDCHFECTDDALNGGHAVYRHCDFDLYGAKPMWSTFGAGPLFEDCDFYIRSNTRETYFCKQGGPVTVINCRYHAPEGSYVGWTAYPQRWLRCYQKDFTLNGKPYVIGNQHPYNTLSPAILSADLQEAPFVAINKHEAVLLTGCDTLRLTTTSSVQWRVEQGYEQYLILLDTSDKAVTALPTNHTDETADFCLIATTADGCEAACHVTVKPSLLPPPSLLKKPKLRMDKDTLRVDYALDLQGKRDESRITWLRDDIAVSTTHGTPLCAYHLTAADAGHTVRVQIEPKSSRSDYGSGIIASRKIKQAFKGIDPIIDTDFFDFPCNWQPQVLAGYWTVDGHKPLDTQEFPWSFDDKKPMWEYGEGFNGAVGKGLLQAQRGARLMYTPTEKQYGDMHLTLTVDPTKTAGQGFGSATGQYMDICLKFDTKTLTGYGLRIIRTVKHAKAVDFLLVRYDNGTITPLTAPVSSTCYRTGCTISIDFIGNQLTAHVETKTPQPTDSSLPHVVDLHADVVPNHFGGFHLQHTGSCGESTTMLHRLQVRWQ
jgi:hypothetical protein